MQQQYVPTIPYVELVYVLCIASGFGREVASRPSYSTVYTEQGTTSLIFLVGITGFQVSGHYERCCGLSLKLYSCPGE
jgi:hypothetical protein